MISGNGVIYRSLVKKSIVCANLAKCLAYPFSNKNRSYINSEAHLFPELSNINSIKGLTSFIVFLDHG